MTDSTDPARKLISICVPVFNEQDNILPFYERMRPLMDSLADRYAFEILFTDNHSSDDTFVRLAELAARDRRVRVLRFSRNFGFQRSIFTNYVNCRGDAAIQIDVDLQDPPEILPEFLTLWEQGYKVVYGVRRSRPNENWLLHRVRKLFYRGIDLLSEDPLPHDAGDFRLIDRCIVEQLRRYSDQQPYLRGLIAAMGFKQVGVVYDRSARERGSSKFNLRKLASLALDGIFHHSVIPLRIATFTGLAMFLIAAVASLYYIFGKLIAPSDWPPGIASNTILLLFSIGMNGIFLGIIGEYVGRIYKNVKSMPLTIIETAVDHTGDGADPRETPASGTLVEGGLS